MGLRRRSGSRTSPAEAGAEGARQPLTAARAKRVIGIGKLVVPLLVPYALAAAGAARARWDEHRAARLGVDPSRLPDYTRPGGALHARLSRVAEVLTEIDSGLRAPATDAARKFAADIRPRLADLSVAVRAAEQMPASRRRAAHRAIGGELDRIETDLLTHLGIAT